jgi:hypothetical protein
MNSVIGFLLASAGQSFRVYPGFVGLCHELDLDQPNLLRRKYIQRGRLLRQQYFCQESVWDVGVVAR